MARRWTQSPPGSNWGEFGDDDQLGRLNLITREKVLQGIAQVSEGRTFCLSLPLDVPGTLGLHPRRPPPRRWAIPRDGLSKGQQGFCWAYAQEDPALTDVVCDDGVALSLQHSTHWDSLAHVGSLFDADGDGDPEPVFYNGYRAGEHIRAATREDLENARPEERFSEPRASALGIEHLAVHGLQGRGVLVDLAHHLGLTRRAVGFAELMRVVKADRVAIEPGDILCLHTGFAEALLQAHQGGQAAALVQTGCGLDGRDPALLQWITDSGIAALVADNPAVEHLDNVTLSQPRPIRGPRLPLHEHCLFKNGIVLGELWFLSDLAHWLRVHSRHAFLLTAPPLRLPGAVGSPVTPIATV